jgi:alkyl hydroperoxide reductase subunit D
MTPDPRPSPDPRPAPRPRLSPGPRPAAGPPRSLDALKAALPGYAKDLKLNLGSVLGHTELPEQQLWGTVLATAIAVRSPVVLAALEPEARARLAAPAYTAAKAAASVMAMNNVFYRTRHLLSDPGYGDLRAGLRMNVIGDPGVDRADFELWSLAVSAVNGCGQCLDSHERVLRAAGMPRETVQEAVKIAAVVQAVATTLEAEAVLTAEAAVREAAVLERDAQRDADLAAGPSVTGGQPAGV